MCGRVTQTGIALNTLLIGVGETKLVTAPPQYNIGPMQPLLSFVSKSAASDPNGPGATPVRNGRYLTTFQWGLVPSWARDITMASNAINARSETVAEKPSFKGSFKYRRCLIPVDGFFEWDRKGRKKVPYYFRHPDGTPLMMAGLWDYNYHVADGLYTCCLMTTEANSLMAHIHHRMPVLLSPKDESLWLDSKADPTALQSLLRPYECELEAYRVTPKMNSGSYNEPDCVEPIGIAEKSVIAEQASLWD